jgi:hypothetical protein
MNHQARRRQEDNLAVVFMGIVLVFLVSKHLTKLFKKEREKGELTPGPDPIKLDFFASKEFLRFLLLC